MSGLSTQGKNNGMFVGKSHAQGGIPSVVVETGQRLEIEGKEWYICREAYYSSDVYDFHQKTNQEILNHIYLDHACKLDQKKMHARDFIVCKVVVQDPKKYNRKGTIKEIVNQMQNEKSCKVENENDSFFLDGGNVKEVKQRYFSGELSFLNW